MLRYYEDLPDDRIAELIGCAPATVRVHAARALATLRDRRGLPATRTGSRDHRAGARDHRPGPPDHPPAAHAGRPENSARRTGSRIERTS